MCSIVGFVARQDSGPNLKMLARIIHANHQRGSDAHGMAWVDARGRVHVYKRPGPFRENLHVLNYVQSARVVVCHLRLTTHGHQKDNINNHPHVCDAGWFVHNGTVSNYTQLISEWGLLTSSECDSETLGLLTCRFNDTKVVQWGRAIENVCLNDRLAIMAIYERPARLVVARRGNPLRYHKASEGLYFASLGGAFPKNGKEFRDSQVVEYRWTLARGGERKRWIGLTPHVPRIVVPSVKITGSDGSSKLLTGPESALIKASEDSYIPLKYRMGDIERRKEIIDAVRAEINQKHELDLRQKLKEVKAEMRERQKRFKDVFEARREKRIDKAVKQIERARQETNFRFDEHDMLIVEPTGEECQLRQLLIKGQLKKCPKCDDILYSKPYADGTWCSCGLIDLLRQQMMDDDPAPGDIILCDPSKLDRRERDNRLD